MTALSREYGPATKAPLSDDLADLVNSYPATNALARAARNVGGALRLDLTLDADHADKLNNLASHWQCRTRKEAIELAIAAAFATVQPRKS